jgi:hypothetical protein
MQCQKREVSFDVFSVFHHFCAFLQNIEKRLSASSFLSVRLYAWSNSAATGGIFMEFYI